jgi:hypothetical protein
VKPLSAFSPVCVELPLWEVRAVTLC